MRVDAVSWIWIREGRVALERCPKKAAQVPAGEWFLPGGKLRVAETQAGGLQREISEEWPKVALVAWWPLPAIEWGTMLIRPFGVEIIGELPLFCSEGTPLAWTSCDVAVRESPVAQIRMMLAAAMGIPGAL